MNLASSEVKAMIDLVVWRVAEKETWRKARGELVRSRGGDVRIAETAEEVKNGIVGGDTIEVFIRRAMTKSGDRDKVKDKSSNVEDLGPEGGRKMGLEEKREHFDGEDMDETLSVPVLLRGIRA